MECRGRGFSGGQQRDAAAGPTGKDTGEERKFMRPFPPYRSLLFACCLAFPGIFPPFAQDFPKKPIRIVVPSAAGSLTDTVPRILVPEISRVLGQPVIVE